MPAIVLPGPRDAVRVGLPYESDPLASALLGANNGVEQVTALAQLGWRQGGEPGGHDEALQVGQVRCLVGVHSVRWYRRARQFGDGNGEILLAGFDVGGATVRAADEAGEAVEFRAAQGLQLAGYVLGQFDRGRVQPRSSRPPADDELSTGS